MHKLASFLIGQRGKTEDADYAEWSSAQTHRTWDTVFCVACDTCRRSLHALPAYYCMLESECIYNALVDIFVTGLVEFDRVIFCLALHIDG